MNCYSIAVHHSHLFVYFAHFRNCLSPGSEVVLWGCNYTASLQIRKGKPLVLKMHLISVLWRLGFLVLPTPLLKLFCIVHFQVLQLVVLHLFAFKRILWCNCQRQEMERLSRRGALGSAETRKTSIRCGGSFWARNSTGNFALSKD